MDRLTVGVVGAGQMGSGIAQVCAQAGHEVTMVDVEAAAIDRGLRTIRASLDRLVAKGSLPAEEHTATRQRITTTTELEQLADHRIVVEAATEGREVKFDLFRRLDGLCWPDTILASNTSSISITEIAAQTRRPKQVIGMHYFHPVPLMSLVEIVRGQRTSDAC